MDMDDSNHHPNGIGGAAEGKDAELAPSDVESPIIEEIPLPTTLGLGQSSGGQSQPEVHNFTRQTAFVKVSDLTKEISGTIWRPGENETSLLVAGDQLIREFDVPLAPAPSADQPDTTSESPPEPVSKAEPELPFKPFNITCSTYISSSTAVVAVDQENSTNGEDGEPEFTHSKIFILDQGLKRHRLVSSMTGTVIQLQWNPTSKRLLCVSSTGDDGSGCLSVFSDTNSGTEGTTESRSTSETTFGVPSMAVTPRAVWNATWTGDNSFTVAGQELLHEYDLDPSEGIKMRAEYTTDATWEKVRYDSNTNIIALATARNPDGDNRLGLLVPGSEPEAPKELKTHSTGNDDICEIAFRSIPTANDQASNGNAEISVLASCSDGGLVTLWDVKRPFEQLNQFSMEQVPALTLAWNPSGDRLAVGGLDEVRIWSITSTPARDGENATPASVEGRLTGKWKWGAETNGNGIDKKLTNGHKDITEGSPARETNGDVEMGDSEKERSKVVWDISLSDRDLELDHDLCWDNSGKRVAFTVANQVSYFDMFQNSQGILTRFRSPSSIPGHDANPVGHNFRSS
jgi:hypothetical protein